MTDPVGASGARNTAEAHLAQLETILIRGQELVVESFDKGKAYNNAIILTGFGGVFALLAVTKDHMPASWLFAAAGLTSLSLFCFVLYLVLIMFQFSLTQLQTTKQMLLQIKNIQSAHDGDISGMEAQLTAHEGRVWVWLIAWALSVFPGFAAGGIMMWFYFRGVLGF